MPASGGFRPVPIVAAGRRSRRVALRPLRRTGYSRDGDATDEDYVSASDCWGRVALLGGPRRVLPSADFRLRRGDARRLRRSGRRRGSRTLRRLAEAGGRDDAEDRSVGGRDQPERDVDVELAPILVRGARDSDLAFVDHLARVDRAFEPDPVGP